MKRTAYQPPDSFVPAAKTYSHGIIVEGASRTLYVAGQTSRDAQGKVVFGTSDSSLYLVVDAKTGKELVREQGKAYVFSSPSVAGSTVYVGVLNGTLEARDLASGKLLWEFQTEASRRNAGWALAADRTFNVPLLFPSNWRESPLVGTARQWSVGSIFSSPLVVGSTVYFGSTDGNLYAVE